MHSFIALLLLLTMTEAGMPPCYTVYADSIINGHIREFINNEPVTAQALFNYHTIYDYSDLDSLLRSLSTASFKVTSLDSTTYSADHCSLLSRMLQLTANQVDLRQVLSLRITEEKPIDLREPARIFFFSSLIVTAVFYAYDGLGYLVTDHIDYWQAPAVGVSVGIGLGIITLVSELKLRKRHYHIKFRLGY